MDKLLYLINYLLNEDKELEHIEIPTDKEGRERLLRGLMNIRPPKPISEEFLDIQDEYLLSVRPKPMELTHLTPVEEGIYLWQGDITTLKADAIVNAANNRLLGCFIPCHGCIDNAIHYRAGVQLRLECNRIMREQGYPEPTGRAKITQGYNLPCKYIIHTVGPIVGNSPTPRDCAELEACYSSCLKLATRHHLKSLALCCISTGEFHFPNQRAAEIAINTVRKFRKEHKEAPEVIFNVYKDIDREIYSGLLG